MGEEVDDLAHLLLGPFVAGDIREPRRGSLLVVELGPRAADTHHPLDAPPGAPAQQQEQPEEEHERKERQQRPHPGAARPDARDRDSVALQGGGDQAHRQ